MVCITVLALIVRGWQLWQRTFYWDDLVIPAQFRGGSFADFFAPYDGHIMPGSIAIQVAADGAAPLEFALPIAIILAFSAAAFVLYGVALTRLLPDRPAVRLLAFTALVFSPFLMVASGWWSAALNALGWQVGFAAVLLLVSLVPPRQVSFRRMRTRLASTELSLRLITLSITASAITCGAFLMTEKAVSLIPAALVAAWLCRRLSAQFFALPMITTLVWAWFIERATDLTSTTDASTIVDSVPEALARGVLPAALGGPWQWGRWIPSQAFAAPSPWLWGPAVVVVWVALGWWLWRRPLRAVVLLPIVGYFLLLVLVLAGTRTGEATTDLLTRNLHYYVDWWSLSVVALALASARFPSARRHQPHALPSLLTVLLVISSTISTVTWVKVWSNDPTAEYLETLKASTAQDPRPLLEQPVPLEILVPLMAPHNTISSVLGRPAAAWILEPRIVDDSGRIVPAAVFHSATSEQGSEPQCGTRITTGTHDVLLLDNPLPFGEWTWEMNAVASNTDMTVTISTPNGLETEQQSRQRAVTVPVPTELATHYVRVNGGGGFLQLDVRGGNEGDSICVGAGGIGPLLEVQK